MTGLLVLGVLCYIYSVLLVGIISYAVTRDGASLGFMLGLPLVITLLIYFLGGPELLRAVAFSPIRMLASLRSG